MERMKKRERNTLLLLLKYAEAIANNSGIALAACNAHFAVKQFARYANRKDV